MLQGQGNASVRKVENVKSLGYQREYDETSPNLTQLFDLTGRLALITGGGSGLGRAIGLGFARYGAEIVLVDLSGARAEAVAAEIRASGSQASAFEADVTVWQQVEAVA